MFDIPDKRLEEIKDIVTTATHKSEDPDEVINHLTTELSDTNELSIAMFYLGQMASVDRNDIIVNATMMMLGGMPVVDGINAVTSVIIHTVNNIDDYRAKRMIIDTVKHALDGIVHDTNDGINPNMN